LKENGWKTIGNSFIHSKTAKTTRRDQMHPKNPQNKPKKNEKGLGHITVPYTKTPKYLQKSLPNTHKQLYTLENIENYEAWSNTAQNAQ